MSRFNQREPIAKRKRVKTIGARQTLIHSDVDAHAGRGGRDPKTRELALISILACLGLVLAWRVEAEYFAMFFAVAVAIAMTEAIHLSL